VKRIGSELIDELVLLASSSARKRAHHNLHGTLDDPIQRLCVGIEPGSYIRPHRHSSPGKWELMLALKGSACVVTFDGEGRISGRFTICAEGPDHALEIEEGCWHTIASLSEGTVLFELKKGPYAPLQQNETASWSPAEGGADIEPLVKWFTVGAIGSFPPVR